MTSKEDELTLADRRAVIDAGFQLAKWLIATLVLLNGAAALATLGRPELTAIEAAAIGLAFINGVISALLGACGLMLFLLGSFNVLAHTLRPGPNGFHYFFRVLQIFGMIVVLASVIVSVRDFTGGVRLLAATSAAKPEPKPGQPAPGSSSSVEPAAPPAGTR